MSRCFSNAKDVAWMSYGKKLYPRDWKLFEDLWTTLEPKEAGEIPIPDWEIRELQQKIYVKHGIAYWGHSYMFKYEITKFYSFLGY